MSVIVGGRRLDEYRAAMECEVAPLAEAFESSGLTYAGVARALGWFDSTGRADGGRVARQLGLRKERRRGGSPAVYRQRCSYARAAQLAAAIGVDPVDVGL